MRLQPWATKSATPWVPVHARRERFGDIKTGVESRVLPHGAVQTTVQSQCGVDWSREVVVQGNTVRVLCGRRPGRQAAGLDPKAGDELAGTPSLLDVDAPVVSWIASLKHVRREPGTNASKRYVPPIGDAVSHAETKELRDRLCRQSVGALGDELCVGLVGRVVRVCSPWTARVTLPRRCMSTRFQAGSLAQAACSWSTSHAPGPSKIPSEKFQRTGRTGPHWTDSSLDGTARRRTGAHRLDGGEGSHNP